MTTSTPAAKQTVVIFGYIGWSFFWNDEQQKEMQANGLDLFAEYNKVSKAYSEEIGQPLKFAVEEVDGVCVIQNHSIVVNYTGEMWDLEHMVLLDGYIQRIIAATDAHMYAAEKHSFSIQQAVADAKAAGKKFVLTENLS